MCLGSSFVVLLGEREEERKAVGSETHDDVWNSHAGPPSRLRSADDDGRTTNQSVHSAVLLTAQRAWRLSQRW